MRKIIYLVGLLGLSFQISAKEVVDIELNNIREDLKKFQHNIGEAMRWTRDYMKAERQGRSEGKEDTMPPLSGLEGFQVGFDATGNAGGKTDDITQFISKESIKNIIDKLNNERKTVAQKKANRSGLSSINTDTLLGKMQVKETEVLWAVPGEFSSNSADKKATQQVVQPEKLDYIDKSYDPKKGGGKYRSAKKNGEKLYAQAQKAYYDQEELIQAMALVLLSKEELIGLKERQEKLFKETKVNFEEEHITITQALAQNYALRAEWLKLLAIRRQIKVLAEKVKTYQGTLDLFPLSNYVQAKKKGDEEFIILDNKNTQNVGVTKGTKTI